MNRVRILSEQVANCIAAGEVVERPASVVKELVENSLDAEAKRVEVEIVRGGRKRVRVVDNGHGMGRDDALLALERHATSKIRDVEDIESILTLGFRGEALPSIAAVSRFLLRTREEESMAGVEIRVNGGRLQDVRETGAPVGTFVEVRDLFFNLPARRKFLRSVATETGHVQQTVTMHALGHPGTAFRLVCDGRAALDLPPAADIRERIRGIYGASWIEEMIEVRREDPVVTVSGFIGKPSLTRANRSEQRFFVNGRPVDSRPLSFAVAEAYRTLVMKGRHAVVVLFLEIDPARVDVNIHPAKREVRFRDGMLVQRIVTDCLRAALSGSGISPRPAVVSGAPPPSSFSPPPFAERRPDREPAAAAGADLYPPLPDAGLAPPPEEEERGVVPAEESTETPITTSFGLRILGTVGDLYVVAESSEGLVLVDQHAAHERVLFDRLRRQLAGGSAPSQRLLLPQTVELDDRDAAFLRRHLETLRRFGIEIGEFGSRAFVIDALPPYLIDADLRQVLRDILDELMGGGGRISRVDLQEEDLARTVCRHAVKARDPLTGPELERLLEDLHATDLPYTCPHGRPTMILIRYEELEKKFGRRGGSV